MKQYLVRWYDEEAGGYEHKTIEAVDLPAAKHKAFQLFCDNSGYNLNSDVEIYEFRYEFKCKGETNPRPHSTGRAFAKRDYFTGMKIRRGGKDNG